MTIAVSGRNKNGIRALTGIAGRHQSIEINVAVHASQEQSSDVELKRKFSEGDKQVRLFVQSAKFEQGRVWFPKEAPWLQIFLEELLSFPDSRHSDQVDSISQALGYKPSGWTAESLVNYNKFLEGLYQDATFARLAGRPW